MRKWTLQDTQISSLSHIWKDTMCCACTHWMSVTATSTFLPPSLLVYTARVHPQKSTNESLNRDRDIRSQSMPLTAGISSWRQNHWGWRGSVSELYVFSFIVCVCLRAARPLLSRGTGRVPQELSQVHRVSRIPAQEILIQIINGSMKNMIQQHLHISCYEALITVKHWPSRTII